jgi:hypothetical protein
MNCKYVSLKRKENIMVAKKSFLFAPLLGLALMAGAVQAATLFTPPLVPDGANQLDCYIINVSDKERTVTIEVRNREGEAVLPPVEATLKPGEERVAVAPASASPSDAPRYCKFIVEGKPSNYRASVLVEQPGVGSISALPAE